MLRKGWTQLVLTVGFLLSLRAAHAQKPSPEPSPPSPEIVHIEGLGVGPIEEGIELLGFEAGGGNRVVKGTPFSAVAVSTTTQTLADGNRIHRQTQMNLYRDSEGRARREVTLPAIGPLAVTGTTPTFTSIHDPVGGISYVLEPEHKIARKLSRRPGRGFGHMRHFVAKGEAARSSDDLKTESLGTQTLSGVTAEGTRYTHTIPAGQIGNEKPIVIVSERWYSPDLQIVVMSKRSDPRFGETTYQLTSIQREEPAATLFQVPPDYTVREGGPGRHMRGFGHPPAPPNPPNP